MAHSNSQLSSATTFERTAYLWRLLLLNVERRHLIGEIFDRCADDVDYYLGAYSSQTGRNPDGARILEIGYGQRPFRLILLHSLGFDAQGVDLDQPLLSLHPAAIASILRANGALRTAKSVVRRVLFDRAHYRAFDAFINARYGKRLSIAPETMLVGDASSPLIWSRLQKPLDLVYSEDVFEHVPPHRLPALVDQIADALSDQGLAVIAPFCFTGISGGHDVGWYPHQVDDDEVARGPAWGHLTGETPPSDTYLNKLRLRDYRALFQSRFEILKEEDTWGELGRRYLTSERRARLEDFSEEELFANHVRFVMRKKVR